MYLTVPRGKNVSIVCTVSSDPVRYDAFTKIIKLQYVTIILYWFTNIISNLIDLLRWSNFLCKCHWIVQNSSFSFSDVTWFFDGKRIDPPPEIIDEPLTSNNVGATSVIRGHNVSNVYLLIYQILQWSKVLVRFK